jgi:hypothetical protein
MPCFLPHVQSLPPAPGNHRRQSLCGHEAHQRGIHPTLQSLPPPGRPLVPGKIQIDTDRVDRDSCLLELCRYIVLNPVRADIVEFPEFPEFPENYKWSSYLATAGLSRGPAFLHSDWILGQFAGERGEAGRRLIEFVRAGVGHGKIGRTQIPRHSRLR